MKSLIPIAFIFLSSLTSYQASASTKMFQDEAKKIESIKANNAFEAKQKKSILESLKRALRGYKDWKHDHPNHKHIRKEFMRMTALMNKAGTFENLALRSAQDQCKAKPINCGATLKSTMELIYNNSDLASLKVKSSFSVIPSAYASFVNADWCSDGYAYSNRYTPAFMAGLIGRHDQCGFSLIGVGLHIASGSAAARVCVGNGDGVNVGVFAKVSALAGVGTALTVGQGGFCQILTGDALSVGAATGLLIQEGGHWNN